MANKKQKPEKPTDFGFMPLMANASSDEDGFKAIASTYSTTKSRRNAVSIGERSFKFENIENGLIPFKHAEVDGNSCVDIRDAIILTQKAYYNFGVFRNVIDLMTEFSVGNIHLKGETKAKKFFNALFKKINLWSLQDKFFREYYRSGNVFIYRYDANIKERDLRILMKAFAARNKDGKVTLPAKYIILNPSDIQYSGSLTFSLGNYYKTLTDYELEIMRNPKTEQDKLVVQALPKDFRDKLRQKSSYQLMPLDPLKMKALFYKKQDYEAFGVPMGYPVLEDISWKAEMRKQDMALTRQIQQAILLVTMGAEMKDGTVYHNQKNAEAMQKLFENQSVARVLISDWTTKAQFVIPDIADILDPVKYEAVNADINMGLNNILMGNEKFANQKNRIDVFIARLDHGRQVFLREFLIPEMERIANEMDIDSVPVPEFDDITLANDINEMRMYARLVEIGALTAEEGMEALKTGRLPDPAESEESQKNYKALRDKGLYEPIIGGGKDPEGLSKSDTNGRPIGTSKIAQAPRKTGQIGAAKASVSDEFSLKKIAQNMALASELAVGIEKDLKKRFKLKDLTETQKQMVSEIQNVIVINEDPDNWQKSIAKYCETPIDQNPERAKMVEEIAADYQTDLYLAGILAASKNK